MTDPRTLLELLACHSTPGDEAEVRAVLERRWRAAGLRVTRLGEYAVTAALPSSRDSRKPVLLVTAHMDSPGFAVDRLPAAGARQPAAGLTRLGGAAFAGDRADGVLKTRSGRQPVVIRKKRLRSGAFDYFCEPPGRVGPPDPAQTSQRAVVQPSRLHSHAGRRDACATARLHVGSRGPTLPADLDHGDRVCFASSPVIDGNRIVAPFLDNRLGCWILAELAAQLSAWKSRYRIVLGATACEELGGFGAPVLARHVQPDLVLVVDATYEAPAQNVRLGQGPVLTLNDASVLLSPARRDQVRGILAAAGIPLQTEVYDYSGTDARAFPHQGLTCPVLPLLLATIGNHSPRETADLRDARQTLAAIACLAHEKPRETSAGRQKPVAGFRARRYAFEISRAFALSPGSASVGTGRRPADASVSTTGPSSQKRSRK